MHNLLVMIIAWTIHDCAFLTRQKHGRRARNRNKFALCMLICILTSLCVTSEASLLNRSPWRRTWGVTPPVPGDSGRSVGWSRLNGNEEWKTSSRIRTMRGEIGKSGKLSPLRSTLESFFRVNSKRPPARITLLFPGFPESLESCSESNYKRHAHVWEVVENPNSETSLLSSALPERMQRRNPFISLLRNSNRWIKGQMT